MGFAGQVLDLLPGVGQADAPGVGEGGERAVIVAAALAQAPAGPVEGEEGSDDQVGRRRPPLRQAGEVRRAFRM